MLMVHNNIRKSSNRPGTYYNIDTPMSRQLFDQQPYNSIPKAKLKNAIGNDYLGIISSVKSKTLKVCDGNRNNVDTYPFTQDSLEYETEEEDDVCDGYRKNMDTYPLTRNSLEHEEDVYRSTKNSNEDKRAALSRSSPKSKEDGQIYPPIQNHELIQGLSRKRCVECYRKLSRTGGRRIAQNMSKKVKTFCGDCCKTLCVSCYRIIHSLKQ